MKDATQGGRHGSDAVPWTEADSFLMDRLAFSLGLVLENHFLGNELIAGG